jgi:alpha-tubulin suppressor-like RCC1 family protein
MVAGRMQAVAEKAGVTMLLPLDEGRGGRITWAKELLWIYMAMAWVQAGGAKKMIGVGGSHSLVTSCKEGAEVWSFGHGLAGGLGHGDTGNEAVPRLIEALNHMVVKQVAAGSSYSMVLTRDGDVFTWGCGYDGRLGHGDEDNQLVPKRVEGFTNVTDIAAGGAQSLAVGEAGAVYTWGANYYGQLGLGDHGAGTNRNVPTEVPGVNGVVAVVAGSYHSFALSRDGTAMSCGWNCSGQLGLGDMDDRDTFTEVAGLRSVVDIDAGYDHTIAVTVEGGLYTWGKGRAIGHGGDHTTHRLVPTKVTGGGIDEAVVVQVAAGLYHSMALTTTGELYTWGKGDCGQLGHGGTERLAVPRVVGGIEGAVTGMSGGFSHSLVTTAEGRVLAFGGKAPFAAFGGLGLGAGVHEALTPTTIDGITMGGAGEEGKDGVGEEGHEGKE